MSTAEILIVFSALMVLIALVTIGIDWIGKPLKHRRFIPRIYRFDDEKLPIDEYGNTDFGALEATDFGALEATDFGALEATDHEQPQPYLGPLQYPHPGLQPPAQMPVPGYAPMVPVADGETGDRESPTVVMPTQAPPRQVAELDPALAASSTANRSAFSDSLGPDEADPASQTPSGRDNDLFAGSTVAGGDLFARSAIAGTAATQTSTSGAQHAWSPGMALDATVDDKKPSLATKAERFWVATAETSMNSHFDDDALARMGQGKAPRRTNPRNGKTEAMQLTGLRQASEPADVGMRWPDDAVDPWNAS